MIEFILIVLLVTPRHEPQHFAWYPESRAAQCVADAARLNAALPRAGQGQIRERFYLCRCRNCGEPWP